MRLIGTFDMVAKVKGAKWIKKYGEEIEFNNPALFPESNLVEEYYEPFVLGTIITPGNMSTNYYIYIFQLLSFIFTDSFLGPVLSLCMEKRGRQINSKNLDQTRLVLQFALPLTEIVVDFHDHLKSVTSGFGSFDYEDLGYEPASLVKVN